MKTIRKQILCGILFFGVVFGASASNDALNKYPRKNTIRVALLLDTSNSMDGLIDQAKTQLWEIVNELSYARCEEENPQLYIALYEYGNDGLRESNGYIRQVLNFTQDLDLISEKLFALRTNGGSEYCGQVIKTSLNKLDWGRERNDLNLIYIAGNEEFTQGPISYKSATNDAKEKDVTVNTIFCGDYHNGISGKWRDAALRNGGDYFSIDHNQRKVYVVTPYDDVIIRLNRELNDTYIYYGDSGYSKKTLQATQDSNAAEYEEAVAVNRAVSKSSRIYKNNSWDLVDAVAEEDFDLKKVEKKTLPKELQGKTEKEILNYVDKQAKERKRIQSEINELNQKRKAYLAKQSTDENNDLSNSLLKSLKKQAKSKNYSWKN